jgi:Antibiotic biosynthesis monooxygenase
MMAVIYRWRLKLGHEDEFVEGWTQVTRAIHAQCGSYGSRLHRSDDGMWVAYARWPDRETRERCDDDEIAGRTLMRGAIAEDLPEIVMNVAIDELAEPS